jgi:hypothetical protein
MTKFASIEDNKKASGLLTDVEYECSRLSRAFYTTGNDIMGETLASFAADIKEAHTLMNRSLATEINGRLHDSQETVGNIVSAVFTSANKQMEEIISKEN